MNTTSRLTKVKNTLSKKKLDALLVSSIPTITYLTHFSNFSKDEREAFLLIMAQPQGLTHKTPGVIGYIITDGRYIEAVQKLVKEFEIVEVSAKRPLMKWVRDMLKKERIKRIAIEEKDITIYEKEHLFSHYSDTYHYSDTLGSLRLIKERKEVQNIERACRLGDEAFAHVRKKIKQGITETFLAFELELFIKKHGADISFPPIVAFGPNSSIPHHKTENRKLKTGDIVLFDFGVKVNSYCSDMTRTIFFGSATAEYKRMYQTVLEAQQKAIEYLGRFTSDGGSPEHVEGHDSSEVESIEAKNIDKVARDYITTQGFPTIPHSLGHGIGLEVHEAPTLSPRSKDVLKPGMVFSIEPGIYIPGFGGVRIEDLVVLEKTGPRLLTTAPRNVTVV